MAERQWGGKLARKGSKISWGGGGKKKNGGLFLVLSTFWRKGFKPGDHQTSSFRGGWSTMEQERPKPRSRGGMGQSRIENTRSWEKQSCALDKIGEKEAEGRVQNKHGRRKKGRKGKRCSQLYQYVLRRSRVKIQIEREGGKEKKRHKKNGPLEKLRN